MIKRVFRRLLILCNVLLVATFPIIACAGYYLGGLYRSLPSLSKLEQSPHQTALVFDKNKNVIGCIGDELRVLIPKEKIVRLRIADFVIGMEDERYYERPYALDMRSIARALFKNINAGKVTEGGSTIEQQTVKQLLTPEERRARSLNRKLKEAFLSYQLERTFNKQTTLAFYLNNVYLGHNINGVGGASRYYFNRPVENLSLGQMATLAGIIHSPETLSPKKHPWRARKQRNIVLKKMLALQKISKIEYKTARKETFYTTDDFTRACNSDPFVTDYVKKSLPKLRVNESNSLFFDETKENAAWSLGLRIQTTIDPEAERLSQDGVGYTLADYYRRQESAGEARFDVNGAMIVLENGSGAIRALVGSGKSFEENQYNNVTQAERQVGSSFKPVVYSYFIEKLLSQDISKDRILNYPISNRHFCCRGATRGKRWCPHNYKEKFGSSVPLIKAITESVNMCALWAAMSPEKHCSMDPGVVIMARRLGIAAPTLIERGNRGQVYFRLPAALGSADITLLELTRAYMVFANEGNFIPEYLIEKISNGNDIVLYQHNPPSVQQRLSPEAVEVLTTALRNVNLHGTGRSMAKVNQPTAGKTGTTNNFTDALYEGFTPTPQGFTIGVRIFTKDKSESLGHQETGGKTALPAFKYFVENYYRYRDVLPFSEETNPDPAH